MNDGEDNTSYISGTPAPAHTCNMEPYNRKQTAPVHTIDSINQLKNNQTTSFKYNINSSYDMSPIRTESTPLPSNADYTNNMVSAVMYAISCHQSGTTTIQLAEHRIRMDSINDEFSKVSYVGMAGNYAKCEPNHSNDNSFIDLEQTVDR